MHVCVSEGCPLLLVTKQQHRTARTEVFPDTWQCCQENKSCSKVLNFLERLDDRITTIRCTHEETVAVVKPWEDIGDNKSLDCVFSEKPADWTNAFQLEISSLADVYDVLPKFMDSFKSRMNPRFLAESEKGMLWELRVIKLIITLLWWYTPWKN